MAGEEARVSILGLGLAGLGLIRRHAAAAAGIVAIATGGMGLVWFVVSATVRAQRPFASGFLFTFACGVAILVLVLGQWLAYRALLVRPRRGAEDAGGWPADLGRILVVTIAWLVVAVIVQVLTFTAVGALGMERGLPFFGAISTVLALVLLAASLFWLGLAAAAGFQQRRWVLFAWPSERQDLWRLLAGWGLANGLVDALWWGVALVNKWAAGPQMRALLSPGLGRPLFQTLLLGLALGLTTVLLAAAWAQAWRQSLGRAAQDPAAVFD